MTHRSTPALDLRNIRKAFGATIALDGVDLVVQPGEVHALVGENGAGKSTLMNVLAGAIRPDAGEMRMFGDAYAPESTMDARRARIALIHQELSLCPHLSVTENILLGMESSRWGWLDWGACRRRALEVLENFDHPDIHPDRLVGELPVAARQVVEICRALSSEARIVLMDEPTSSLQRQDVERLFTLIRRLRDRGIAVIYISHFLEEVRAVADRYTVLRDGRSVGTGATADATNDQIIAQMVGRPVSGLFPARDRGVGEVLLEVRDLSAPPALQRASFELRRGEILGIAGLMGSGRSEMMRALFGLDRAASGSFALRARSLPLRGGEPADRLRQGFGYLSEDRKGEGLALPLSIADNLTLTRMSACCSTRWGWLNLQRQREQAAGWIREVGIRARTPDQPVQTLSGGNQQKVAIARLLHQDAEVLLLDEPTRGIDIGSKAQVYETISRAAASGKAILMVSSYLPELFGICDRLAVMSRGFLSEARPIDQWTPESVLAAAIAETPDARVA